MCTAAAGKFMVVEGQVMDTMKWQPQPLACEVSDIGHAVYDGADALMLGAATSIGINPVEVSPPCPSCPHPAPPKKRPLMYWLVFMKICSGLRVGAVFHSSQVKAWMKKALFAF